MLGIRSRLYRSHRVSLAVVAAVSTAGISYLHADVFTYTNNSQGQTGTWSGASGWNAAPVSDSTTSLVFQNVSTGSTSYNFDASTTNDIATSNPDNGFKVNQITFSGTGLSTGFDAKNNLGVSRITVNGSPLIFSGSNATVHLDANGSSVARRDDSTSFASASFKVASKVVFGTDVTFTGNGSAHFDLRGVITGNGTITKTGSSYLDVVGAAGSSYAGNIDVQGGRFRVSGGAAVGTYAFATTGNLNIGASGQVDSLDGNMGVGSISGTGSLYYQTNGGLRSVYVNYNGQSADQFNGSIKGLTVVVQNGTGTLDLTGANMAGINGGYNAYWGTLIGNAISGTDMYSNAIGVSGGTVEVRASANGVATGISNMALNAGTLKIVSTAAAGTDLALTGQTVTATSNNTSLRTGGGNLVLDRGTGKSLTFTVGNAAQTSSALSSQINGGLVLVAAHGLAELGNTEKLMVVGVTPTVTNGMVNSQWIGQDTDSQKTGEFLTYDSGKGLVALTAASYDLTNSFAGSTNTSKVAISTNVNIDSNTTAFALKNSGNITIAAGKKLTIGGSAGHAGLILNGGTITGGTLDFGNQDGFIYTSLANGRIDGTLSSSSGNGVTFNGPGTATLGTISTSGKVAVNSGAIHVTMDATGTKMGGSNSYLLLKGGVLESSGLFARGLGTSNGTVNMAGPVAGFAAQGGDLTVSLGGSSSAVTWGETSGFLTTGVLQFGSLTADRQVVWSNNIGLGGDVGTYNRIINVLKGAGTASAKITGNITSTGTLNALVKDGDGTLILAGHNTYAGNTTVANGVLRMDGTSSGQGHFTVNGGGSLAGNGTIGLAGAKKVSVAGTSGKIATLAPGSGRDAAGAAAGGSTLSIASDTHDATVALGDYSALAITLSGDHNDRLNIDGNLDLSSLLDALVISVTEPLTLDTYTIVHFTGSLTGTFDDTSSLASYGLGVVYDSANGNINLVSAVPEPTTLLLAGVGAFGLVLKRRARNLQRT